MKTSAAGLAAIRSHEGERLTAYQDSVGVWTVGVGHTTAAGPPTVKKGMRITATESAEILARDLCAVEADVNRLVKVPISQNQFDALVSLVFNIGTPSFQKSTLLKALNSRDYQKAADQFLVWNKGTVKGRKVAIKGLTDRRQKERAQFLAADGGKVTPETWNAPKPVPSENKAKETVAFVQARLWELGYTEVGSRDPKTGAFDGQLGKMTKTAILAFRNENDLPLSDTIDDGLLIALGQAKPRELPRNDAAPAEVRKAAPEVKTNWLAKIGAAVVAIPAAVGAFFDGILGNISAARGYVDPLKDMVGDVPGWVWLVGVAAVAGGLYLVARHGEQKGIEAYAAGERR